MKCPVFSIVFLLGMGLPASAADFPKPVEAEAVLKDLQFNTKETADVRMHYLTIGKPERDKAGKISNAVLILHATTGSISQFMGNGFAGELFGKGQPLDGFYLIIPDSIGHGKSSKPSDGLHAKFPRYNYADMIAAQHRLLTEELKVDHVRLVMGTSMGGMHTWLWGQEYPDFMDALMPLASLPTQISGRNRLWRNMASESIRTDPEWKDGEYKTQPRGLRLALETMQLMSSSPAVRQKQAPTSKGADAFFEKELTGMLARMDANDTLYAIESSRDYDPGRGLEKIKAPLLAINFADDLINPPELGILEREIKRVKNGRAIVIPASEATVGHGTHTKAVIWKEHLEKLLKETGG
jgi:homoserine O-acetyltransferase/O-succinyltransferase